MNRDPEVGMGKQELFHREDDANVNIVRANANTKNQHQMLNFNRFD